MSTYNQKRRRSSGRYSPHGSQYLPRINRGGGSYSGPKNYVRHRDFKYSGMEQLPKEPKTEIGSYTKSSSENYSQKSQAQPDIEPLLEELKRTKDTALHDEVTNRLNYENEQMENAAGIPEDTTEPIEMVEVWTAPDGVTPIDEVWRRSEEAESERVDEFFDWINDVARNPSTEQFETDESLEPLAVPETNIETISPSVLESTLNELDALAVELYANPLETKVEESIETESNA